MTIISVAVRTKKFLFGVCDSTVDTDVGTGYFSFVMGTPHACGHAYARSHVSPGMDWDTKDCPYCEAYC